MTQRILQGATATLTYENQDSDGSAHAAAGTVTVGVTRGDGSTVLAAGTATTGAGTGKYTVALTSAQTALVDELTATWVDSAGATRSTTHLVVGGFVLPMTAIRAFGELTDANLYPDEDVIAARAEVEDELERICDRAFVQRYRRATLDGSGSNELATFVHDINLVRAVRIYGSPTSYTDLTAAEINALNISTGGVIRRADLHSFGYGVGSVVVGCEYGLKTWGSELQRAALTRLRDVLTRPGSSIPDRAKSYTSTEGFSFDLVADDDPYKTLLPDVDRVYDRYSLRGGTERTPSTITIETESSGRWQQYYPAAVGIPSQDRFDW